MIDLTAMLFGLVVVLVCIIAYQLYYTQALVRRNDTQSQKAFDALLALVNKQAAVTAANVQRMRHQTEHAPAPTEEEISRARRRAETDRMLEEISRAHVLTPEQEQFMEERGHGN